jgi:hypothetical protein
VVIPYYLDLDMFPGENTAVYLSTKFSHWTGKHYTFYRVALKTPGGVSVFGSFGINPEAHHEG